MVETLAHGKTVTHMVLKCNLSISRGDKSSGTLSNDNDNGSENVAKNEFALFQT